MRSASPIARTSSWMRPMPPQGIACTRADISYRTVLPAIIGRDRSCGRFSRSNRAPSRARRSSSTTASASRT